jgi:phosphoribosylformylglycinamidine synthase
MVLSVPQQKLDELLELCTSENVEATVIGHFGTDKQELILKYLDSEVGRLSMHFLHYGIPMPTRKAVVERNAVSRDTGFQPVPSDSQNLKSHLLQLLSHPNIASKHWIIRQYDHEVQGGSVIKPLTGPLQVGPSDAAVIRPKLDSNRGVAIGCGIAPHITDPYQMALASIDEAMRNVVAVGADANRIAILDNFCWPSVDDERTMGSLVQACEACRDAALAYGIPFISGKDSLHNQFTNSETGQVLRIPNTLLISAIGVIDDVRKCVTMDLKQPGNCLCLLTPTREKREDLSSLRGIHIAIAEGISRRIILSCHDASDGGALVTAAEMSIASDLGIEIVWLDTDELETWTSESRGMYLVELAPAALNPREQLFNDWFGILRKHGVYQHAGGTITKDARLRIFSSPQAQQKGQDILNATIQELRSAWRGTLDW